MRDNFILVNRIVAICFLFHIVSSCDSIDQPTGNFDVLITDAKILDGSGKSAYTSDILVRGDSIAYIGSVDERKISIKEKINAKGRVVSPGFIDTHAHGDPIKDGEFQNFIHMGVTTICLGQDGFSHASEDLNPWINEIDSLGVGVNVINFIGHSTLRELSGCGFAMIPTSNQLLAMQNILTNGMSQGSFGLSTGLEYEPGYYAQAPELAALAKVVGHSGGLIMSHMRNEDNDQVEKSIHELLLQGKLSPIHISHFKVVYGAGEERARQLLSILDSARRAGIKVTSDVYPYTASYTGIGIVFPDWAKAPHDYNEVLANRKDELRRYLHDKIIKRNGPGATLFGNGTFKGMTLAQVADSLHLPFEEVLMDVVGPEGASGAYFVMNEELQSTLIQDSLVCIASDGSSTMHHPRGYGTFAKIINHYVNETNELSLSEAIRKMTVLPAAILGLKKRGLIKVGNKADLLVFDPMAVKDLATYEQPHLYAIGFDYVLINGKCVLAPERDIRERAGRFLRKQAF